MCQKADTIIDIDTLRSITSGGKEVPLAQGRLTDRLERS